MPEVRPPVEGTILIPAEIPDSPAATRGDLLWQVLRRSLTGEILLERTWLVRWPNETQATGDDDAPDDDDSRAHRLALAIESRAPEGTICVRYETKGILVLASDKAWPGPQVVDAVESDHDLRVWQAVDILDDGLLFVPVGEGAGSASVTAQAAAAKRPASKVVLSDAEYTYFPLWDVAANQVMAYLCRAAWAGTGSERFSEGSVEVRDSTPERLAAIDIAILRSGLAFVRNALDNYGSVNVVVPIHCGVFSDPGATAGLLEAIGREIWPVLEHVSFELIAEPEPHSLRNVDAAVAQLASFGRGMMLRVDAAADDVSPVPAADWLAVGFEATSFGEDDISGLIDVFAGRVGELGYPAYVLGLSGTPVTVGAINAGFAYIGSDAIAPPLTSEEDAQTQPADILKAILASRAAR